MLEFCIVFKDKYGKTLHIEDEWMDKNVYTGLSVANVHVNTILREKPLVADNYAIIEVLVIKRNYSNDNGGKNV